MKYTFIIATKKNYVSQFYTFLYVILFGSIFMGCNRCKLSPCVDSDELLIFSPTSNNPNNTSAINNTSTPPTENKDIKQEMINRIQNQVARGAPVGLPYLANVLRELQRGDRTNLNTTNPTHIYAGTALHSAAHIGDLEIVKALLKAGANINAKNSRIGTPLCDAVRNLQVDVAAYLLSEGADKTLTSGDNGGNITPYKMAKKAYKADPTNHEAKRLVDMLKP